MKLLVADLECRPPPPQEFDPLPTQRLPLCGILRYSFLVTHPKTFLKAPSVPRYTNFEWGAARGKKAIFGQNFQKRA